MNTNQSPEHQGTPPRHFWRAVCIAAISGLVLGVSAFVLYRDERHRDLASSFFFIVPVISFGPILWPWALLCQDDPIRLRWKRAIASFVGMSLGANIGFVILYCFWH